MQHRPRQAERRLREPGNRRRCRATPQRQNAKRIRDSLSGSTYRTFTGALLLRKHAKGKPAQLSTIKQTKALSRKPSARAPSKKMGTYPGARQDATSRAAPRPRARRSQGVADAHAACATAVHSRPARGRTRQPRKLQKVASALTPATQNREKEKGARPVGIATAAEGAKTNSHPLSHPVGDENSHQWSTPAVACRHTLARQRGG